MLHLKVIKKESPESSHHTHTYTFFPISLILLPVGNDGCSLKLWSSSHDMSQIIMFYTLNLYSAICEFYLSKTGKKGRKEGRERKEGGKKERMNKSWRCWSSGSRELGTLAFSRDPRRCCCRWWEESWTDSGTAPSRPGDPGHLSEPHLWGWIIARLTV